jgi:hypothetical protein
MELDFAQRDFQCRYAKADGLTAYETDELLRYQGGYLYRIVEGVYELNARGERGSSVPGAEVVLRSGPNRNVPLKIEPGCRQKFNDETYVVLSVLNGLKETAALSASDLRASSERDAAIVKGLLENPDPQAVVKQIDNVASSIVALAEQRRIANDAANRVGRDPDFRSSVEYPLFWTQQIVSVPDASESDTQEYRNAVATNAGVLQVLRSLIVNLPPLKPDCKDQMKKLRQLTAADFKAVSQQAVESAPKWNGLFRLEGTAVEKLTKGD